MYVLLEETVCIRDRVLREHYLSWSVKTFFDYKGYSVW